MTVRAVTAYRHHFHVALKINLSRAASVLDMRTDTLVFSDKLYKSLTISIT